MSHEPTPASDALVDMQRESLLGLSHAVHDDPETGFLEHRAAARVAGYLREHGFAAIIGAYGLETAVVSRVGSGGPVVAFLAEYDALPEIGHACGHNVICASSVGAYVAAARHIEQLGGTAILLGTPAEENGTGKEIMARAGAFDGVDAALMVHPHAGRDVLAEASLGLREVTVTYRGRAAHASANPSLGLNALDAAVTAYQSVSQLRQSLLPTDRLHGIITDGGTSPNVIPDRSGLHFYLRAATPERLRELTLRLQAIFDAAALATGTAAEVHWDPLPPCLPVRSNAVIAARFGRHFTRLGRTVHPADPNGTGMGSTDLGNVSLRIPAIHPMVSVADSGVGMHTEEFVQHARGVRADEAVIASAKSLAAVAIELVTDGELLREVTADFVAAGGAIDVPELLTVP
ncbi:M20 family metallopeptidase [Leucobacter sp. NPDC058333]|uniref:M20 family metallopeptidase n=1 Tax=Leucobacter sp. NPDC058333 TaxID=3346450 RepID=UPI00364E7AEE